MERNYDSWSNFFVGLGGKKDKSIYTRVGETEFLPPSDLTNLYINNGLASRIIDVIADDMTREWIFIYGDNKDAFIDLMYQLKVEEKFNEALKLKRLYGGALMIFGVLDGQTMDKPINPKRVKYLEYIKVIPSYSVDLSSCIFDTNPNSPTFGQILQYSINFVVNGVQVKQNVHASRCIEFHNEGIGLVQDGLSMEARYWGVSSLQRVYEALRDLGATYQSVVNILFEFIIGKYKFEGLNEMLADGAEGKLVSRMEIMEVSKSILNAVILGENEEYSRDYANLAGIPEVIDRFMLLLCGYTGIPVTRLFGRSPAGLNATGENDLRNYYDLIASRQRNELTIPIKKLLELLALTLKLEVPRFEFNSLYQLNEQEKAELNKIYAETENITAKTHQMYIEMGVKEPADIEQALEEINERPVLFQ